MADVSITSASNEKSLPPIRQDLDLQLLGNGPKRRMIVYDPLSHKYYDLRPKSAALLALWHLRDPAKICAAAAKQGIKDAQNTLDGLQKFLSRHGLLQHGSTAGYGSFHRALMQERSVKSRFANLLFFRIRLGNPEALLDWLQPFATPLMTRGFRWLTVAAFLTAFAFLMRRPEEIAEAIRQTASLQGAGALILAIALVKFFHELGHAFQARKLGLGVPGCGIMFMVGFPMPFTELSDSWRLHSQKDRLLVDAGGILAELTVAAWAALAFVFWPDGTGRGIMFALAGSSLVMSLFVNLNPLMRFDGYFLLADATGIKNLQPRSKALAIWAMREALFGYNEPVPERFPPVMHRRMIAYAIAVYVYRVFLTFSIAALLFFLLPRAIGAPVTLLYLAIFFLAPVVTEMSVWLSRIATAIKSPRAWRSLIVFSMLIAFLLYPFDRRITVPVRLAPQNWQEVTSPPDTHLVRQPSANGAVSKDDILWQFEDISLRHETDRVTARIKTLQTQIERSASSPEMREQVPLFRSELARMQASHRQLMQRQSNLNISARFDGTLYLGRQIVQRHVPLALGASETLGYILPVSEAIIWAFNGYIPADKLRLLGPEPVGIFRADDMSLPSMDTGPITVGRSPVERIAHPEALQQQGGPILTRSDERDVPQSNVHAVSAVPLGTLPQDRLRVTTGRLIISGAPMSIAERVVTRIAQVIVQNAGL